MVYRIEISPEARDEAERAYLWIGQNSRKSSEKWLKGLFEAIDTLSNQPHRCQVASESDQFPVEIRQLLYGKRPGVYRVLFTIAEDSVRVLHIRHSARDELKP
jgi:plasmid stabilization system protein ParE